MTKKIIIILLILIALIGISAKIIQLRNIRDEVQMNYQEVKRKEERLKKDLIDLKEEARKKEDQFQGRLEELINPITSEGTFPQHKIRSSFLAYVEDNKDVHYGKLNSNMKLLYQTPTGWKLAGYDLWDQGVIIVLKSTIQKDTVYKFLALTGDGSIKEERIIAEDQLNSNSYLKGAQVTESGRYLVLSFNSDSGKSLFKLFTLEDFKEITIHLEDSYQELVFVAENPREDQIIYVAGLKSEIDIIEYNTLDQTSTGVGKYSIFDSFVDITTDDHVIQDFYDYIKLFQVEFY